MEGGWNLFDVKVPDTTNAIRGRGEVSFWVRVKGDSDASLLNEVKRTQYFTKEEKEFLENYLKEKFNSRLVAPMGENPWFPHDSKDLFVSWSPVAAVLKWSQNAPGGFR